MKRTVRQKPMSYSRREASGYECQPQFGRHMRQLYALGRDAVYLCMTVESIPFFKSFIPSKHLGSIYLYGYLGALADQQQDFQVDLQQVIERKSMQQDVSVLIYGYREMLLLTIAFSCIISCRWQLSQQIVHIIIEGVCVLTFGRQRRHNLCTLLNLSC